MLFVAPPGSVSDAMVAAIEREFSWISVRHVQDMYDLLLLGKVKSTCRTSRLPACPSIWTFS